MKNASASSQNEIVTTAAEALARALRDSQEWRAYSHAQEAAEKDAQLSGWLSRYQQLNQADFGDPTGRTMSELTTLRDQIQRNPLYRQQQDAGAGLVAALQDANRIISAGLGLDFAKNAAPRSGCCG